LAAEAVSAHKRFRRRLPYCTRFWPLGLPGWEDEWLAVGLRDEGVDGEGAIYLTIWRRSDKAGRCAIELPMPPSGHQWEPPVAVFPSTSTLRLELAEAADALHAFDDSGGHVARVVTLKPRRTS